MNFNEVFVVRPTNSEMTEWMITIGNEIASEERFSSEKKAQARINKTDWNLVAVLAHKMAEAIVMNFKNESEVTND